MVCCLVCCCCCCCCCLCCCFWARRGFCAEKQEILSGVSGVPAMRLAQVLVNGVGINVHVWISVHMVFNIRGYIFLRLWDITVHTRPDGDLENLAIEKCTARDLKITLLYSASHGVLDLVALTCLTSWMRGVPCSFYLRSTYALTFTSQCMCSLFSRYFQVPIDWDIQVMWALYLQRCLCCGIWGLYAEQQTLPEGLGAQWARRFLAEGWWWLMWFPIPNDVCFWNRTIMNYTNSRLIIPSWFDIFCIFL